MSEERLNFDQLPTGDQQADYERLVWTCFKLVENDVPAKCARRFLDCFPNPAAARLMTSADLRRLRMLGPAGVDKILPVLSLGLCVARAAKPVLGQAYSSRELGHELINRFAGFDTECVEVGLLNVHNEIIALEPLFIGGFDECPVYSSRIFQLAVKFGARGVVLAHNHPTGTWRPSQADLSFCRRLSQAAGLLNMELVDFLVVGRAGYYSWREHCGESEPKSRIKKRIS